MTSKSRVVAVIPARYDSTRFPGKVLAKKTGKYLIQHTYEAVLCAKGIDDAWIATDSSKVYDACQAFGGKCVMTSDTHRSGTDRIAEAVENIDCDIVVNVQGDEPEIEPANIEIIASLLIDNPQAQMATLVTGFTDADQVANPNCVKVVLDNAGRAVYFSRSVIPYDRGCGGVGDIGNYHRHLGIYAYRKDFLHQITRMPAGRLEQIESLEQLWVLENGYSIMAARVEYSCEGIDTADQYERFVERYMSR